MLQRKTQTQRLAHLSQLDDSGTKSGVGDNVALKAIGEGLCGCAYSQSESFEYKRHMDSEWVLALYNPKAVMRVHL